MKWGLAMLLNWKEFEYEHLRFYIVASEEGICYIGSPNAQFEEVEAWAHKALPNANLVENNVVLADYEKVLKEYFLGTRRSFELPLHLVGTDFQQKVWKELQLLSYGEVVSYSAIAERIGKRSAVRAIGSAIGANPVMIFVPCHRVIGKNGKLTGFRGGLELKEYLLALEKKEETTASQ